MSTARPLHYLTIAQAGERLRHGDVSVTELTAHMLERIEAHDPALRAYATVTADLALSQAAECERELAAGQDRGPLHGIPIAVKDLCNTAGIRTAGGCQVLDDNIPTEDATVVKRLREAGAVLLGKLHLTEGAMAGYNPAFPVPENPWRKGYWSGASSSGSGSATAAGLAFATLGSDTGGSIRHPAAVCGTTGLKPTWGLVSRHGVLDLAPSLDHVGPLTRSAADAGDVLDAISGPDPLDPTTLPAQSKARTEWRLGSGARPLEGLRVGWDERYNQDDLAADFASAVNQAGETLVELGASLVPFTMPARLREYLPAWRVLCSSEAAYAHRATYPSQADRYGPWFGQWLAYGNAYSARDYAEAQAARQACVGEMLKAMTEIDLFACPSTPRAAYPVSDTLSYGAIPANRNPWDSRFTVPMDFAGLPALALPCGLSNDGLPLSFQLVGPRLSESLLVQVGSTFETVTEWHQLHPPGWD